MSDIVRFLASWSNRYMVCEDQKEGVVKSRKALLTRSGRVYQGTFAICFLVQSHTASFKRPWTYSEHSITSQRNNEKSTLQAKG